MKMRYLLIIGLCGIVTFQSSAQSFSELTKVVATDRSTLDDFGGAVAISGDYAVVGAAFEDEDAAGANTLNDPGSAYVFEKNGAGNWVQVQKIVASDREAEDHFGLSVAISGDYLVIGADDEDHDENGMNAMTDAGAAYIFERDAGGTWNQVQKIVASDRSSIDNFGVSVSISGDYAVVGANWQDLDENGLNQLSLAGAAYIFERDGAGTWNEVQKIVASDRDASDYFGQAVAVNGSYMVVSAPIEEENAAGINTLSQAGSAYIFERNGGGIWNEVQKIVAFDRDQFDRFGNALSISGDYLVVGAEREDEDPSGSNQLSNSGSAYIFERNGAGVWNLAQKVVASNRTIFSYFGHSVSLSGNRLIVGADREGNDDQESNFLSSAGAAYMFERDAGGNWNFFQKIVASDRGATDHFGIAVAIDGSYALCGAHEEDQDVAGSNTLNNAGSAYFFKECVSTFNTLSVAVCDSFTTPSGDETYYVSGTYMDTISNAISCDSILTINLTINNSTSGSETIVACDNYLWSASATNYTTSGTYQATLTNVNGCDSVATLNLTINNSNTGSESATACTSFTWPANGISYTSSGNYQAVLTNVDGCDSTVTLNLTILNSTSGSEVVTACNSYTWPTTGSTYAATGTYTAILTNSAGCDSIVTLDLTISQSSTGTDVQAACGSYTWIDGNTYASSNNSATHTLTNAAGCDSVVTLDLTITTLDVSVTNNDPALTAVATGVTYQWLNCDDGYALIAGETNQTFTATANGNFAVEITSNGCVDTSACSTITSVGLFEQSNNYLVNLYPNPTNGVFTVELKQDAGEVYHIHIMNGLGQIIQTSEGRAQSSQIDLTAESPGVYFVAISSANLNQTVRLVKR